MARLEGVEGRGRPRFGWLDCVKVAYGRIGMTVEAA